MPETKLPYKKPTDKNIPMGFSELDIVPNRFLARIRIEPEDLE